MQTAMAHFSCPRESDEKRVVLKGWICHSVMQMVAAQIFRSRGTMRSDCSLRSQDPTLHSDGIGAGSLLLDRGMRSESSARTEDSIARTIQTKPDLRNNWLDL